MKTLFWIIALFALAVGLVVAARYNEGYVLLVLPPYRVDISLNLLFVLLAGGFVLLYSALRLVTTAVLMPSRVREYRLARRRETARSALLTALEAYFEGRYAKAEQSASQSLAHPADPGEHPRLALIVAARAAHELRAYDRRDAYLQRVAQDAPDEDALRVVTAAELLLDQRRASEALQMLEALPRKHTAALKLELRARQQTRNWGEVATLVGELEKRSVFDAGQAAQLRTHALLESFRRKALDPRAIDEAWKKIPEEEKRGANVALAGAQSYVVAGRGQDAQQIVEQSLEAAWDSRLVALYAETIGRDPVKQIERAEGWLKDHPADGALLLTLGKLCARQGLWGKAQSYLEASVSVDPSYSGHVELARLHEKLGNADSARRHYRQALDLALSLLPGSAPAPGPRA